MKVTTVVVLVGALLGWNSAAYAQAGAQASSSASSSSSVQADKSGAQASSDTAGSAQAGHNSASLSNGTALNAALSQPVDARKNKSGDPVTARTTQPVKSADKVVIPRGTKLVGHVTEAKARAKGESESAVGIVFDKAILKNGQEIPLNVTIQALAAAQSAASSSVGGDDLAAGAGTAGGAMATGRAAGGGALGGVTSAAGGSAGAVTNTAANVGGVAGGAASGAAGGAVNSTVNAAGASRGAVGGLNGAGQLTSNSQGVFGLNGLNLSSAASNSTQGSLITSASKNVHLDSGTQLLLVSQGQASAGSGRQ
jgi:hypothetical protein